MYTNKTVNLKMQKPLVETLEFDPNTYLCEVLEYEQNSERILLRLSGNHIQKLALNTIYECQILLEDTNILCTGIIKERYIDERGCILNLRIESGFYEINIK
jgi:hypothetical protein